MMKHLVRRLLRGAARPLWQRIGLLQRDLEDQAFLNGACGRARCPHPSRRSWLRHRQVFGPADGACRRDGCPLQAWAEKHPEKVRELVRRVRALEAEAGVVLQCPIIVEGS